MADQKRKLVIEILGNAKDAAQALGDVRSDTDRAAERFVAFGQTTVAASAVGAVGLYKLATAAGDYAETQSAAEVIFGDAVDTVIAYGEEATKTAGLSKRAAVEGANTFGTFGKSAGLAGEDLAGFSTEMVQLAGDLASFKNTSPEEAIEAIGAALRGESEPIRRYGVLLDDATLKQRAMTMGIYEGTGALTPQQKVLAAHAEILAQTNDAQGDYLRTSDSLANQQRTLAAEFENLKVGIGQGVLPVVTTLVGGAGDLLSKFGELDAGTQDLIGKMGGIVVTGGLVLGSLSLVAGKAIEARDRFTTLGADGTRSLNNVGKAAAALGAAGAALAVYQLGRALRETATDSVALETALNNLSSASSPEEVRDAIMEAAEVTENWVKDLGDFAAGQSGFYNDWAIEANGLRIEFDNLDDTLKQIKTTADADTMQAVIDQLRAAAEASNLSESQLNSVNEVLDRYQDNLDSAAGAAAAAAEETPGATEAVGGLGTASGEAADELADMEEAVRSLTDGVRELQGSALDADQAQRALLDATDSLVTALAENGKTIDINTAAGRKNRDALDAQVKASFDLAQKQSLLDSTGQTSRKTLQDQADTLARLRREGVIPTDEAYLQLLATYQLTPEAIETRITADTEEAKRKAFDLAVQLANMPGVPAPLRSQIQAAIDSGNYVLAEQLLNNLARDRTMRLRIQPFIDGGLAGLPIFAPYLAKGGRAEAGMPHVIGEEGPEIFIPDQSGTVLPNDVYRAATAGGRPFAGGRGGGVVELHVHLNGPVVPDTARWVLDQVELGVRQGATMPELRQLLGVA